MLESCLNLLVRNAVDPESGPANRKSRVDLSRVVPCKQTLSDLWAEALQDQVSDVTALGGKDRDHLESGLLLLFAD